MCGIAGFWNYDLTRDTAQQTLNQMTDRLEHRGPDGRGTLIDGPAALGHRRLAILDTSESGAQPMASPSGRFAMVYNGEVFNHLELRRQLDGPWRSTSDTETLLHAFDTWGIQPTIERTVGMFACAVYDRIEQTLTLVRDRLGVKPLYFGKTGQTLIFGSELRVFRQFPGFQARIRRDTLAAFMRANCVPHPMSIYEDVQQLPPGTLITFSLTGQRTQVYWSATHVARRGLENPLQLSATDAEERLHDQLREAVRLRLLSDVPVGAFLSGGIDSSTIVALMQAERTEPVHTFSIGFEHKAYDESAHARQVAQHLGTCHTELQLSDQAARDLIPRLPEIWDEPFADSSQIPTWYVCKLAREHVTVALSGDGGDELFGGYNRHTWGPRVWNIIRFLPARKYLAKALLSLTTTQLDTLFKTLDQTRALHVRLPTDKLQKLAQTLPSPTLQHLYLSLVTHWQPGIVLNAHDPGLHWQHIGQPAEDFMLADTRTYLPDDILTKVDRASMSVGLEARVPFLDHRVVELAWHLPLHLKIQNDTGKWLLRQVLDRYVPRPLIDRPKMGFGIPLDSWLRGPLKEWASDLLSPERLKNQGFFDADKIQQRWQEHLAYDKNWQHQLWDVLMFQAWLDTYHRT